MSVFVIYAGLSCCCLLCRLIVLVACYFYCCFSLLLFNLLNGVLNVLLFTFVVTYVCLVLRCVVFRLLFVWCCLLRMGSIVVVVLCLFSCLV